MAKAVRYHEFGGIDVLRVDEVERPVPGDGQVLVRVKAAGVNPSEAVIRTGALSKLFPSTFPSGQGSDLAGVIEEVGTGVGGFSPGDEVIGFTNNRAAQAELVLVEVGDLTRKPGKVSWEVAGSLHVAGVTAWGAVHAVQPKEGETVVISGAAGGVGSLAVQLARRTGATVIGLAGESNHEWLESHGVIPLAYGDGVADRIRAAAPGGVDAFTLTAQPAGNRKRQEFDMSDPLDWNEKTIAEFRANEGRVGGNFEGAPIVLLHHRGRKSGREHVTPVMYLPHDTEPDIIYVFATKAGAPTNPDWYHNLTAAGSGSVERGTEKYKVTVRELTGAERDRVYAEQARRYPGFAGYARQTAGVRTIPVLELSRA